MSTAVRDDDLRRRLGAFARRLAACTWHDYCDSMADEAQNAERAARGRVEEAKAEIGRALLEELGLPLVEEDLPKRESQEGWGWPANSRKAHHFRDTRSLCGKWQFFGELEEGNDRSADNCTTCKKKKEQR